MSKLKTLLATLLFGLSSSSIAQTYTFNYTGSVQTWTVPSGVTSISVDAWGASGGEAGPTISLGTTTVGKGGRTQATLTVTPGAVLDIYVGGAGPTGTSSGVSGGYNGGASSASWGATWSGGGGGGASDIRVSPYALGNRLIVAAGGGGAGYNGACASADQPGGDGGGLSGATVVTCSGFLSTHGYPTIILAGGGTQTAGGAGGWLCCFATYTAGSAGTSGSGGSSNAPLPGVAGGGGGGYYGGGGGCWMGGGGGSSYTDATLATGVTLTSGYNTGNGQVTIVVLCSAGTITGTMNVCAGSTTTLTDTTGGSSGTWTSSSTAIATVGSTTGVVTGVSSGTATITYTVALSCGTVYSTAVVTVNPLPVITGTASVCVGSTTTLSSSGGGTWSSSSTLIATVGSSTGVVTGVSSGTATITCVSAAGCSQTQVVTVNPVPAIITGTATVCVGSTTTLSDATTGGTWSSTSTGIATIGSSTGVVTGVSAGTSVISYTLSTGCYATKTVTVYALPGAITGLSSICAGTTTTLGDVTGGGTWTSGTTSVATVGSGTGVVTGVSGGVSVITYTLSTGCLTTFTITVNPQPSAITGTLNVCVGYTTTLTDTTSSGLWSCSTSTVATIGSLTGLVTAISPGTDTITYTLLTTGCTTKVVVTVNAAPGFITGVTSLCIGSTTTLSDLIGGGTWISTTTSVATIGSSSGFVTAVSAGTSVITYTLPTGCFITTIFTVNVNPVSISGASTVCIGYTTTETDATPGGSWTSSNPLVATIGTGTGLVTGVSAGTTTISYILPTGCYTTMTMTVNTNPVISGPTSMCAGNTITLSSSCTGPAGSWSSGSTAIATVGSSTGIVTGISAGTAAITCFCSSGCFSATTITVNPVPGPITGPTNVCVGLTITVADITTGGSWSSSNPLIATIGSGTGLITGISAGTAVISYTLPTGCFATVTITVNSSPSIITGTKTVCVGSTTLLGDVTLGGVWTSGSTGIATVGSGTGLVTGISGGTSIITYSLGSSCSATTTVTVYPLPAPISGASVVCVGATTTLTDLVSGGTWTSSAIPIATVGSGTGVVSGISGGPATITYTTGSGCYTTKAITVNPAPAVYSVTGGGAYCAGGTGVHIGLSGSALGVSYQLYAGGVPTGFPITGTGLSIDFGLYTSPGTYTVVATDAAGCSISMTGSVVIVINPLPLAFTVTGGGNYCAGGTGVIIGLSGSSLGVSYQLMLGGVPVTSLPGTGLPISFGLQTAAGTYTVVAADLTTGCSNTMLGSATVAIDPLPLPIVGPTALCAGTTITLTDATPGGVWTSSTPTVATVGFSTGIVAGIITGTTTITYTSLVTGCYTTIIVTVSVSPVAISGPSSVCVAQTITLTDLVAGGTWSCGTPLLATVGSLSGIVTGVATGLPIITYSLGTGCTVYKTISVNPAPSAILGTTSICVGGTTTLTDATPLGTWSSAITTVATITGTGLVTGTGAGTSTISYTVAGCPATTIMTVNPTPTAIGGPSAVCMGGTITLTDAIGGGSWSSTSTTATVGSGTGSVTGVTGGTAIITYAIGSCKANKTVTVNPTAPITGSTGVCIGTTTTLSDAIGGGVWTSSAPTIASVGSSTGLVTGVSIGTATITYTLSTGCYVTTTVTVNTTPTFILGPTQVCVGSTITLTDGAGGGTWTSVSTGIATIGSSMGIVTGISGGTSVISYSLGSGCFKTTIVTVNALPAAISGSPNICMGLTATFTDATGGGTWSSSAPTIASVGSITGIVTGVATGVATISYTLTTTSCAATMTVNITPAPGLITGGTLICVGQTATLSDPVPGGTWTSGTTSIATVGSASGVVSGASPGTSLITYTLGGCTANTTVTVIPLPSAIAGPTHVCVGQTISLSDATAGGVWSSSINTIATIGSGTGLLTGQSSGTSIVSYTLPSGCASVVAIVVNPISPILGNLTVCAGLTTALTDTTLGGHWSSGSLSIATVGTASGVVTGVSAGTSIITYALSTGCAVTATVTVNPAPLPITGTASVCVGQMTPLSDASPLGTWSSSDLTIATVNTFGVVSGVSAGLVTISYTFATGCPAIKVVTVNPLPLNIIGPGVVCIGSAITLTDPSLGGTWSSSAPTIGSIAPGGVVTGVSLGTTTIAYTISSTGCANTKSVSVNSLPSAIIGTLNVCVGSTTPLSDAITGGNWTSTLPSIASVDYYSGVVSGVSPGYTQITYSLGTGCTTTAIVTVNAVPLAIVGPTNLCQGSTITLTDPSPGGAWSSSNPLFATVGTGSGIVTGVSSGPVTISYTAGNGCAATTSIFVNPLPAPITGITSICLGFTSNLSDASPFGAWSSSNTTIAPVSIGGVVTGSALGTATISYALSTGCAATTIVTVNPLPSFITGSTNLCIGTTTTLSDGVPGGTWSSTSPGVATIGSSSGLVTGITSGATTIVYTLGAGCTASLNITVNPLPPGITGPNTVCATQSITLSDGTPGGTWTSSAAGIATIGSSTGDVIGVSAGTVIISYTAGCTTTYVVTVNPMPGPITGSLNVCLGGTSTLHDTVTGGLWYSSNTTVATVGSSSGIVSGVSLGSCSIIYQLAGSCFVTAAINVYPLPIAFTVTGGGNHCAGDTGVHIGLTGSTVGVNYLLYRGATAVGTFPGTGTAMDFGLLTVGGTYTVIGTSTATGCSKTMLGSAIVGVIPTVTPTVVLHETPGDIVCAGTSVTFTTVITDSGSTPVHRWLVNGFAVALTPGYTYIPADGDEVSIQITSNAVCASPATVTDSVHMTVQPFANPSVGLGITPADTVCQGTVVNVSAVTEYGGTAPLYTWVKNAVPVAVGTASGTYSWTPNDGDVIYCALSSNYPCRLSTHDTSSVLSVTVVAPVMPVVSITANPGVYIGPGQSDTLTATVINAVTPTYQWYVNGAPVSGATTNVFISSSFNTAKEDSVSCMVASGGICPMTTHEWVYIDVTSVKVQQVGIGSDINVVPNPNKGEFMIKGSLGVTTDEEVSLELTDMLGQVVYRSQVIAKGGKLNEKIQAGSLANGMYMLTLRSDAANRVFHVVVEQ